jgi:hypothetical protein
MKYMTGFYSVLFVFNILSGYGNSDHNINEPFMYENIFNHIVR